MNRVIGALVVGISTPWLAFADPLDVSKCEQREKQHLAVPSGRTVLVEPKKGVAVLIRLSTTGDVEATYQWRLVSHRQTSSSGEGRVFEDFERIKLPSGDDVLTRRNSPRDLRIFAGNVVLDWSAKDKSGSWVYFCPALASVKLVE